MPCKIVHRWQFQTVFSFTYRSISILLKISQSPVTMLSSNFFYNVVPCLCYIDYQSLFCVWQRKRIFIKFFLILLRNSRLRLGSTLLNHLLCLICWMILLYYFTIDVINDFRSIIKLNNGSRQIFLIIVVIYTYVLLTVRLWTSLIPTRIRLFITETVNEVYFVIYITISLD
jgi:hypothetical protein